MLSLLAVLSVACTGGAAPDAGPGAVGTTIPPPPRILATTSIVGALVRGAVGDAIDVEVLIPPDDDPATARIADLPLGGVRLLVAVGAGYEAKSGPAIERVRAAGIPVLSLIDQLAPLPKPDGTGPDPSFWLDPDRAAQAVRLIGEDPTTRTLVDAARLASTAAAFDETMRRADEQVQARLLPVGDERRSIITDDLGIQYFAARYTISVRFVAPATVATGRPTGAFVAAEDARSDRVGADAGADDLADLLVRLADLVAGAVGSTGPAPTPAPAEDTGDEPASDPADPAVAPT